MSENLLFLPPQLTGMVPAAPSGASSPPAAFERHCGPEAGGVLAESVWGQITDLQPGELTEELLEGHPEEQSDSYCLDPVEPSQVGPNLPELSILHLAEHLVFLSRVDGVPL